jgi:hypothetical protein
MEVCQIREITSRVFSLEAFSRAIEAEVVVDRQAHLTGLRKYLHAARAVIDDEHLRQFSRTETRLSIVGSAAATTRPRFML